MSDLEKVHARQRPAGDQRGFDGCFGVPGEEGREAPVADDHDHRSVVDVAFRERGGGIGLSRVEDLHRGGGIQHDPLAGPREFDGHRTFGSIGHQPIECRILEGDPGVQHGADPMPVEDLHEPGNVVLVRVAQDQKVDPPREEREVRTEAPERQFGIGTAVDEHRGAARRLDQDRVSLPDVQCCHVQVPIGPPRDGDDEKDADQDAGHRDGTQKPARDAACDACGPLIGRAFRGRGRPERPGREAQDREPSDRDRRGK